VAGTSGGAVGHAYGDFNALVDNDYIAEVAEATLVPGDANGDGVTNGDGTGSAATDDVTFFIDHFLDRQLINGFVLGDLGSRTTQADLNYDGVTNLADWFILRSGHVNSALASSLDLGALIAARGVPEPASAVLLLTGLMLVMLPQRHRR
jgi:hypothetical protein